MSSEEPVLGNLEQTLCYPSERLLWIYSKLRNSKMDPVSLFSPNCAANNIRSVPDNWVWLISFDILIESRNGLMFECLTLFWALAVSSKYFALLVTDNLSCPLTKPTIYLLSWVTRQETGTRSGYSVRLVTCITPIIGKERLEMNVTDEDGWWRVNFIF